MENDKTTINEELDHIRNSINQKNEIQSDDDNFILLDKIVSKGKKYDKKPIIEDLVNVNARPTKKAIARRDPKNVVNFCILIITFFF